MLVPSRRLASWLRVTLLGSVILAFPPKRKVEIIADLSLTALLAASTLPSEPTKPFVQVLEKVRGLRSQRDFLLLPPGGLPPMLWLLPLPSIG